MKTFSQLPIETRGWPGVAVFDFDKDGDMDLYLTNGPGVNNSLFVNQFSQTGVLSYVDMGYQAGIGASEHDSFGTCYGDIDIISADDKENGHDKSICCI